MSVSAISSSRLDVEYKTLDLDLSAKDRICLISAMYANAKCTMYIMYCVKKSAENSANRAR